VLGAMLKLRGIYLTKSYM